MYTTQNFIGSTIGLLVAYVVWCLVYAYWRLAHIPGPLFARLTNLQRMSWVKSGRSHEIHHAAHQKYGDVVRFGPNMVSVAYPGAIPTIYPMRPGFPKGDFYRTLMPYTGKGKSLPAIFNTRDEALHKKIKSPVAPLFSLTNVLTLEPFVERVLHVMFEQLDARFAESRDTCDLAAWIKYFAFDVMGTLTLSKRYGFLEEGKDVNNMLVSIWDYMKAAAPMTQIPWFDELWNKSSWTNMFRGTRGFLILKLVREFIEDREKENTEASQQHLTDRDMLSRFLEIQKENPSIPPWSTTAWTFSNVFAGSDSTSVVLCTIWYNLLAHQGTMGRLYAELIEREQNHSLTRPFPKWDEVSELPYLDACINEAVRLHPPFCLPFERVVPPGGITIGTESVYLPEGTVVGMNPYVANRHKPTFGEDADEWNPDRWLGRDEQQRKKMEQSVLTVSSFPSINLMEISTRQNILTVGNQFGAGRRVCLGKHVAMLEMKKLVPALLLNYEFQLLDRSRFRVENFWFFQQRDLGVKIKKRASLSS